LDYLTWSIPEKVTIEIRIIKLKLKKVFETSFGKDEGYRVVMVTEKDGCLGFGEAPVGTKPLYSSEFLGSVISFTEQVIPQIKRSNDVKEMLSILSKYRGNQMAKAMIEYSFLTLLSCLRNESLVKVIGGKVFKLPVQESIGITKDEEELVKWAEEALSWGARRLKVKILPGWDVDPVKILRREFPGVQLLADANGAYDPMKSSHWEYLSKVATYVDAIEQPFPPHDLNFSAKLSSEEDVEVVIDESADTSLMVSEMAHIMESTGAKLALNVKPPRLGGLTESLNALKIAEEAKMPLFIGGMLETAIGRSLNMVVASAIKGKLEPSDFSPEDHFFERPLARDPYEIKCGFVELRDKPGLLFDIDLDYLNELTIEKKTL